MPVSVVKTDRDEHNWKRAKEIAKEQGHEGDWGYIMGIYKRMNPDKFTKQSSLRYALAKLYRSWIYY